MITKTSLTHPTTLMKIKRNIMLAIKRAHAEPTGVYVIPVDNKRGATMLTVCGIRNKGFRVCDSLGNEITDLVKNALRDFHSKGITA